jgi:MFS family permease
MTNAPADRSGLSVARIRYTLALLCLVSFVNYMDRYALAVLIEPIRKDLGLTDGEIGLLTGIAFAVAFSVAAVPVGRLADRYSRRWIIGAAVTFWSLSTAACGLAVNLGQLLLGRIGVAIGEAGGFGPVQAVVSDLYPKEQRAGAMSVMFTGGMLGVTVGFAFAGVVSSLYGWRSAFLVMGGAGALLGPVVLLTLRDPVRGGSDGLSIGVHQRVVAGGTAFRQLRSRRAYVIGIIGFAIAGLAAYGTSVWVPTFLARKFALSGSELGAVASLTAALPTTIGTLFSGFICNRLARRDPRWMLRFPALCLIANAPLQAMQILAPSITLAAAATVAPSVIGGAFAPPLLAALQTLAGARLRATGASVAAFAILLIGQGMGPSLIGALSSWLAQSRGASPTIALQQSLCVALALYVVGGGLILFASRSFVADVERARTFDRDFDPEVTAA